MQGLAAALIERIRHAALQYLPASIARCRSVGMETVARRSERAWRMRTSFWRSDHAIGSSNANIVQAYSWSCLTPDARVRARGIIKNIFNNV